MDIKVCHELGCHDVDNTVWRIVKLLHGVPDTRENSASHFTARLPLQPMLVSCG